MARLDLYEQQRLNTLKEFWQDYGKYIIIGLIVIILGYFLEEWYSLNTRDQAQKAAILYTQVEQAIANNDNTALYNVVNKMQTDYPKREYTAWAVQLAAKAAFTQKDFNRAGNYLNWAINNIKDRELVNLAILRLVDVYIDQKKFDQGLQLTMRATSAEFQPLFYEKRGDLYLIKGDNAKARDAYKAAIQLSGDDSGIGREIQMKLDVLGN